MKKTKRNNEEDRMREGERVIITIPYGNIKSSMTLRHHRESLSFSFSLSLTLAFNPNLAQRGLNNGSFFLDLLVGVSERERERDV